MFRGKVTNVTSAGVFVQTADFGTVGPCQAVNAPYTAGDMVLCVNVGDDTSPDLVVVGTVSAAGSARMMMGTGTPSGVSAPVGSTWRQTDANSTYGNLTGLLWNKVGTGTTLGTDWLVDFEGRWISYTPSVTGWANVTASGRYTMAGKLVRGQARAEVGASTTYSATLTMSLPQTRSSALGTWTSASGLAWSATSYYLCLARLSTNILVNPIGTAGIYGNFSATSPNTWTTGNFVDVSFAFEVA